ncbi:MAG: RNA polymerase sigma factor [Catalinimonas sp.]
MTPFFSDQQLLRQMQRGDRAALGQLYTAHRREFMHWIQRACGCDETTASDVYQDAIIAVYENAVGCKLVELRSSLKTYLFAVGRRTALHRMRARTHAPLDACYDQAAEVPTQHAEQAREEFVRQQLATLDADQQKLLRLFYFERLSLREIAERLGYKNEQVAKTAKARCMKKLRANARRAYALIDD